MLYLKSNAAIPVQYISSGNLVNEDGFVHPRREIDSYVLLLGRKGILHICANNINYDIGPDQFLILFPHKLHFGYKPSSGYLSYYWVHFYINDPDYRIYDRHALVHNIALWKASPNRQYNPDLFIIPATGRLSVDRRPALLFSQLLDISKRGNYRATYICHYALSVLLLEITKETMISDRLTDQKIPATIIDIIEWIRVSYSENITVDELSKRFNYHPTYISSIFKKFTGYPLMEYINRTRITVSKNLLEQQPRSSVITVATLCGFNDEKYYMKLFKKYEGITPSEYRKAIHQKKLNQQ